MSITNQVSSNRWIYQPIKATSIAGPTRSFLSNNETMQIILNHTANPTSPHLSILREGDTLWLQLQGDPTTRKDITTLQTFSIGRSSECNFVISDQRVSPRHATVNILGGFCVEIIDNGSANGTCYRLFSAKNKEAAEAFSQVDFGRVSEISRKNFLALRDTAYRLATIPREVFFHPTTGNIYFEEGQGISVKLDTFSREIPMVRQVRVDRTLAHDLTVVGIIQWTITRFNGSIAQEMVVVENCRRMEAGLPEYDEDQRAFVEALNLKTQNLVIMTD